MAQLEHDPVEYRPKDTILKIGGETFTDWNEANASPETDEEWASHKSTDGQPGWRHDPDPRGRLEVTFSGSLPGGKRKQLREMMGQNITASCNDTSGTKDSVTLNYAKIIGKPPMERTDDEPEFSIIILGLDVEWGG